MPNASPTLEPAPLKLLQLVYDRFQNTGVWPPARSVRLSIRQDGDLTELCRELGHRLIDCVLGDAPAGACQLRVHALLHVQGAERDKALIVAAIQYLVKRYVAESESRPEVVATGPELENMLGLTEQEAHRVTAWLNFAPMVASTFTPDLPDRRATLKVSPDILRLEGIASFEEYLQRTDEIERNWAQRAVEHGAKVKRLFQGDRSVSRTPHAPTAVFDLFELHPKVRTHVEQLFLDGHYSAAVRSALTVLEVQVRKMVVERGTPESGIPATPASLMATAFSEKNSIIRLNEGKTPFDRDEQRGFQFLAQGIMAWPRGSLTHELPEMEAADALERLALVSMLMKRLDLVEPQSEGGPAT